jgi:hypothetical protein
LATAKFCIARETPKIHGFLRLSKLGTLPAHVVASPATGEQNTQGSGNQTMTYQANNVRNAFFAVTIALVASVVLMAGAVGPAIA